MIELPLSPGQRRQLLQLLAAGAIDHESAKGRTDPGMNGISPVVLNRLRVMGLADSRKVQPGPLQQFTVYWLTPEGVEIARRLT